MSAPPIFFVAGKSAKVISTQVVALYDPQSGQIRHVHAVHVHQGGRNVPDSEAIEEAHDHARRLGHDTRRLKVKVSNRSEHAHLPHRIDTLTDEFVPINFPDVNE